MNEKIPEQVEITPEQRLILSEYLKANSDSAIGQELQVATPEEEQMAERLLSLDLPSNDSAYNRHARFADSNYKPDVALRSEAFIKAGLEEDQGLKIRRHDILLNSGPNQIPLKVINLIKRNEQDRSGNEVDLPGGVIFFGKINFEGEKTKYINLTEEEKALVQKFLDLQAKETEKTG